nr:gamma-glutamylcyclotransferase [uncultured Roseateles sp.]
MPPSRPDPDDLPAIIQALPARSQALYRLAEQQWCRQQGLLLFAYGSLIWKPGFAAVEQGPAQVHGFHRALRLRSLVNRGNAAQPGLVLCLLPGGSCRGLFYRVSPAQSAAVLCELWAREMVVGSYQPRWLNCLSSSGPRRALSFTLERQSPGLVAPLTDAALLQIFKAAHGRYGSTLDYLQRTVQSLQAHGIQDRELERQLRLAAQEGLLG